MHPHSLAEMSPETATKYGLKEGSLVSIETERGKALFTLKLTNIVEDVVSVEYGWWYPEISACEPKLGGVWISNANLLTNADIETSDPLIGTWTYNGIPCRISTEETVEFNKQMELANEC